MGKTPHTIDLRIEMDLKKVQNDILEYLKVEIEDTPKDEQPITCARFGCGKHLSLEERRFGKYCCECSGKKKIDIMKVLKLKR